MRAAVWILGSIAILCSATVITVLVVSWVILGPFR